MALVVLDTFLTTAFDGGRHVARIEQLAEIERQECAGT
jgi:ribose 5-phosphate isomerase RpiB